MFKKRVGRWASSRYIIYVCPESPSSNLFYVDRIRRHLNRTIHNHNKHLSVSLGGLSFRHMELGGFVPGLFTNDLVHLSVIDIDIFNMGLGVGGPQPEGSLPASVFGE